MRPFCRVTVDTCRVTAGGLSVAVEGPSKAEIRCAADCESDHSYNVTYYPLTAGTYSIGVRVATKHIPGSPFTASVLPPGNVVVPLPTTGRSGSRPKYLGLAPPLPFLLPSSPPYP